MGGRQHWRKNSRALKRQNELQKPSRYVLETFLVILFENTNAWAKRRMFGRKRKDRGNWYVAYST